MHNTSVYTQQNQAPAVGYWHSLPLTAALNQMGNSHSSSTVSHIPTPASLWIPRLASQLKGSEASEQRNKIPPPQCQCHLSRKKLRHIWCGEERRREKWAFRCCTWKDMTTFVLSTGNVWVQCWQSGSDWMLSSSLRRDKQKKKKSNKSSPKAVVSNPWVKPS